jgi:SAM-dependent methyltransferase
MIRPFGLAAMERLSLRPGEHVLDIGCGCGDTLLALAERVGPSGSVTGADLSKRMLARARERSPSATLVAGDVTVERFERRFDAVYSRFGVMFFVDPVAAFARVRTLLSSAATGRIAFACWRAQAESQWASIPAAAVRAALPEVPPGVMDGGTGPGPFAFADRSYVADLLSRAGFGEVDIVAFDTEVELGSSGVEQAAHFSLQAGPAARLLADTSPEQKARALAAVIEALAPYAQGDRVALHGGAWTVLARP